MKTLPNRFSAAGRVYRVIARNFSWVLFERYRGSQVDFIVTRIYTSKGHERLPGVFRWGRSAWAARTKAEGDRILQENSLAQEYYE